MFQMMGFFAEFERGMMDVKKSKKSLRACGGRINAADSAKQQATSVTACGSESERPKKKKSALGARKFAFDQPQHRPTLMVGASIDLRRSAQHEPS
jgi:hypothetical protein